jgi:DNA-binding NarL/FixJ family response regulator
MESIVIKDKRLELVGSVTNGVDAFDLVSRLHPEVLLLDMSMPEMDGLEVARKLIQSGSTTHILPLSGHTESEYVLGAMEAGVRGYLLKDERPSAITNAIIQVSKGGVFVSNGLLSPVSASSPRSGISKSDRTADLVQELAITPRLLEVLVEAAQGLTNEEIGDRLFKSPHTVRNQIESLKAIAGVNSRPALVAWAWRNGFSFLV